MTYNTSDWNDSQMGSYRWDSDERKEVGSVEWALKSRSGGSCSWALFSVAGIVLAAGAIGMNKVSTLHPWCDVVADTHCFCVSLEKPVNLSEPVSLSSKLESVVTKSFVSPSKVCGPKQLFNSLLVNPVPHSRVQIKDSGGF